jgi:FMN phosphatase YigB (HAD superfamily)
VAEFALSTGASGSSCRGGTVGRAVRKLFDPGTQPVDFASGARVSMTVMTIRAVVFDIGGVLEITPDLGVTEMWESRLGLAPGELNKRMYDAWRGGSLGTISEDQVHQALTERLGFDKQQLADFMGDIWREYLGTANTELINYARLLRPRYRTGIVSNSFVGAREREQDAYGFEDLVDEIIYSHELRCAGGR